MIEHWPDLVGMAGAAIFLAAFAYANAKPDFDRVLFNIANLAGAILLMISLSIHWNLPAFLLEAAWALIALWGLGKAISARRRRA